MKSFEVSTPEQLTEYLDKYFSISNWDLGTLIKSVANSEGEDKKAWLGLANLLETTGEVMRPRQ